MAWRSGQCVELRVDTPTEWKNIAACPNEPDKSVLGWGQPPHALTTLTASLTCSSRVEAEAPAAPDALRARSSLTLSTCGCDGGRTQGFSAAGGWLGYTMPLGALE